MAGINTLLSTIPAPRMRGGVTSPPVVGSPEPQGSERARTGMGGDTFAQGQWWKNRGQPGGSEPGAGDWQAKVALRAYGAQQGKGSVAGGGDGSPDAVADPVAGGKSGEGGGEEKAVEKKGETSEEQEVASSGGELTPEERQIVAQLQVTDTQVRAHEQAHLAAAGGYATSGASFSYQSGPDGRRYAIGGEVQIDTSSESDPEKTIRKMGVVRAAALAPANPSSQDRSVAATATTRIVEAQREFQAMRAEEAELRSAEAVAKREEAQQEGSEGDRSGAAGSQGDAAGGAGGRGGHVAMQRYGENANSAGSGNLNGEKRLGVNLAV